MAEEVHPGSWLGDSVEEFKRLPTWGKFAVGAAVVGVAGFAYYQYKHSQGTATSMTSAATGTGTGMGIPAGATDGSSGGSTPTLPAGGSTSTPTGNTPVSTPPPSSGIPRTGTPIPGKPIVQPKSTTTKKPAPKLATYTVQRGDNLSSIAAKLGVSGGWQALYNANKGVIGSNPNLIYAGTKLQVPK